VAPLNGLLGVALASAAGCVLAALFSMHSKIRAALAIIPFAAHPYFLENLSYSIAGSNQPAALLCATVAASLLIVSARPLHWLGATGLVLSTLALYPTALNVFFLISAFWVGKTLVQGRAVSAGVVGIGLYWFSGSADVDIPNAHIATLAAIPNQWLGYWGTVWADWSQNWVGPLIIFTIVLD